MNWERVEDGMVEGVRGEVKKEGEKKRLKKMILSYRRTDRKFIKLVWSKRQNFIIKMEVTLLNRPLVFRPGEILLALPFDHYFIFRLHFITFIALETRTNKSTKNIGLVIVQESSLPNPLL